MGDASAAICFCGHPRRLHEVIREGRCLGIDCPCRGFMRFAAELGVLERAAPAAAAAPAPDPINAPAHYTRFPGGIEPIDIAEHLSFNLGNALKYVARAGFKGDAIEDLKKARFYIDREITRLSKAKERSDGK